jgi:hypothetical protein
MNPRCVCHAAVIGLVLGFGAEARANDVANGASAPAANAACAPFGFILRQDFTDISLYDCPSQQNLLNAVGSRVSLTFDELAHKTSASIDGLAAGVLRFRSDVQSPLVGVAIGPYVQGNGMNQFETSTSPSKTTDTLTAGGFIEFAIRDAADNSRSYFRFHGGETFGNTGIGSNTFVGEWIPVYGAFNIGTQYHIPGTTIDYIFSPEIMVQYDQLVYGPNKYRLFSTNNDAFRVGPQIVVKLWVDSYNIDNSILRLIAERTTVSITYHASTDVYSGRSYSWLQQALTYNLDDSGHFAISASYGYGNSEATANMTSQVKLGLAAKF